MLASLIVLLLSGSPAENILNDTNFEHGLELWHVSTGASRAQTLQLDGVGIAEIEVPQSLPLEWPHLYQEFPAEPGQLVEAKVEAQRFDGKNGYGAYIAVESYDTAGKRLGYSQSEPADLDGEWTPLRVRGLCPEGTKTVRMVLLMNGHGKARFRNPSFKKLPPHTSETIQGDVSLVVTDTIACADFIGFGYEDDGWFYNEENAALGITPADIRLRENRIRKMKPDWVRMFFWYKDWMPEKPGGAFRFDSDNMKSHYKTLNLYEKLGTAVNVVGVEWGLHNIYKNPQPVANAKGELLEHLKKTKKFSCIKYWTLTNEPNLWYLQNGYSFDEYVALHLLVKQEIEKRGLDIQIVGSDDTNGGTNWFRRCVNNNDYFRVSDIFASHRYFSLTERDLSTLFFTERMEILSTRQPTKSFVVAEFGFQDHRSTSVLNPLMRNYPYAVWSTAFAIQGLNLGTSGFSIWCLHDTLYPGNNRMEYGLWDGKSEDWKERPVYYAWEMFCRLTQKGSTVWECTSSHKDSVEAVRVDDVLFWVNQNEHPVTVVVSNFPTDRTYAFTEEFITGPSKRKYDRLHVKEGKFAAPAMSFGYARKAR